MLTRKDYLEHRATHAEYYREIYQEAVISYAKSDLLPDIKKALKNGDKHLNSIPLAYWDSQSISSRRALHNVFLAHGDFYSVAGGVCAHKQAACDAAREGAT